MWINPLKIQYFLILYGSFHHSALDVNVCQQWPDFAPQSSLTGALRFTDWPNAEQTNAANHQPGDTDYTLLCNAKDTVFISAYSLVMQSFSKTFLLLMKSYWLVPEVTFDIRVELKIKQKNAPVTSIKCILDTSDAAVAGVLFLQL